MIYRPSPDTSAKFNRRVIFIFCLSLTAVLSSTMAGITRNSTTSTVPVNQTDRRTATPIHYKNNKGHETSLDAPLTQVSALACPATLMVDDAGDGIDVNKGDEVCADANGDCTLRAAIEEANALSSCGPITIDFSAVASPITLGSALPTIQHDVNINGPGASSLSVDGADLFRVFEVGVGFAVSISDLTITRGSTGGDGGGIRNAGSDLTLTNCAVTASNAVSGGGIFNQGSLTLVNTTVSGNDADNGAGVANSGGLTLANSTINDNFAANDGGGVSSGGALEIINSTISDNAAGNNGGGILSNAGPIIIRNSIVAYSLNGGDCHKTAGTITSQGHNLASDATCTDFNAVGDRIDVFELGLDVLADNGGPTETVALVPSSPAVNAGDDCVLTPNGCGDNNPAISTDQRGIARPQGSHVDIGAFELQSFVVNTSDDHNDGRCNTADCTLREAIFAANAQSPAPRLISFNIPATDLGHFYYQTNGGNGVSGIASPTTSVNDLIPDIDSNYPHSWWSIAPTSPLPELTNTVFIDGYSQPGASVNTKHIDEGDDAILRIELNGVVSGSDIGLDVETGAEGSKISGLVINNFAQIGVFICGDGSNEVSGNFIGTDVSGTLAKGGADSGVMLDSYSFFNLVGGDLPSARNLISGHTVGIGLDIFGSDTTVEGNYIGTDRNGLLPLGNKVGVRVEEFSEGNVIGCSVLDGSNIISGNSDAGVLVDAAELNAIVGNFIGTNRAATGSIANGVGVSFLDSSYNYIGFLPGGVGNVISGNGGDGVLIKNSSPAILAEANLIQGNFIGTDKTGTVALANGGAGVEIDGSNYNEIGCTDPEEANLISGNKGDGVKITGGASFNLVHGNFIGVAADGITELGNDGSGVEIYTVGLPGSSDNLIGDDSTEGGMDTLHTGARNSKLIGSKETSINQFAESQIKTDSPEQTLGSSTTRRLPNALIPSGSALRELFARSAPKNSTANKQAGGLLNNLLSMALPSALTFPVDFPAGGNIIANNGGDGVRISNPADVNNLITKNWIYSNTRLGIDLVGGSETNGVTANDALDVDDPGPNHLQNFPDITGADANAQTITGVLHSSSSKFKIEFFLNETCDGSGYGEGQKYIGAISVTANASGDAPFTFNSPATFIVGQFITATASDSDGNTSEFSACFLVPTPPPPPTNVPSFTKGPDQTVAEDSGAQSVANWSTNISPDPETGRTVTFLVQNNTNPTLFSSGPEISSTGTLTYTPAVNANGSATITIALMETGGGGGTSPSQTFVVTVTEVNDAPTAVNDTVSNMAEDSGQRTILVSTLTGNDSKGPANESDQSLSIATVSNPVGGSVGIVSGNVVFTPTADYFGPASFEYTVTDNGMTSGGSDPRTSGVATVSFIVTEVNDAPTAVNDTLSNSAEDSGQRTILSSTLTGNDSKGPANESGQTLIVKTVGSAVGGTVSLVGGNVIFTQTADYNGPASFQYNVEDNGTTNGVAARLVSGNATASFVITEVNDAPTAVGETLSNMAEDSGQRTILSSTLTGNDSKGPANESGQTLIVKTVGSAVGGTVSLVGGNVIFTPTADYNGPASFQYTVEDNGTTNGLAAPLVSGNATASFVITEVNDAPRAVGETLSNMAEDSGQRTILSSSLTGNDSKGPANESGQTLIVKTVGNAVGGTVSLVGGNVIFTPTADYFGPASFDYTVEDNGTTNGVATPLVSGNATASFIITEVNDSPIAVNDPLGNMEEDAVVRTIPFSVLTGNDSKGPANESGQTLIVKTVSNPVGLTVIIVGGTVRFTPLPNYNGPASFNYTVEDNGTTNGVPNPKTSGPALAHFNITAVADTPSVTNATTNANTQTTSGLVISRNPADGAEVTHFKITGITAGTLFKNNGATPINNGDFITFAEGNAGLKFTPGITSGSFTIQASTSASDAGLGGGTVQASIIINPLGGVIRFSSATYSVVEGAGLKTITVERSGDTSRAVTVDYASSDHSNPAAFIPCTSPGIGVASSRCDFTTAIGTLSFAAGETSKTFNVLISQDNYVEGPETLSLSLSNLSGGAVFGVPQTATLEITDDLSEPAMNPIDNSADFVRAQYHDTLGREPDAAGLAFWTDNIEKCNDLSRRPVGQTVAQCIDKQRESTAIAFFMSPEFQMTGGFVYHLYKGSLTGSPNYDGGSPGRFPNFLEFMYDKRNVSEGIVVGNQISGAVVEANRNRLAGEFVLRPEFAAKYGGLNNTLYVQELFNTTGIMPTAAEKQALINGLDNSTETRASVLRKVVDGTVVISESNVQFTTPYGQAFYNQENLRLFVYLEYAGYLRRNPDAAGFNFWLGKLNFYNGDPFQAEMVRSFILSPEYRSRFGQP